MKRNLTDGPNAQNGFPTLPKLFYVGVTLTTLNKLEKMTDDKQNFSVDDAVATTLPTKDLRLV